jgi:hypothetical protein
MLGLRATGGEPDFATFWRGVGERRGGEVTFYTFATYIGRVAAETGAEPAGTGVTGVLARLPAGLPGLLYLVGDRFWFEDFEKDNWLLRLIPPKRPFAKTEIWFDRPEVIGHRVISRAVAYRCVAGRIAAEATLPLGRIARFFSAQALQVDLRPHSSMFFEVMRQQELLRLLD